MDDRRIPYNVTRIAGETYVVPGLTNAGFVNGLLIDTCEDPAPFAGVPVDLLAITHGHADHFAIAHRLRDLGARVVAARDDASLVENPDINIRGMFSWARPGDFLVTKLFRGTGCEVDAYVEDWADSRATPIPLPGHTMGHYGFLTTDGVLFSGDALYLKDLWERHPLPYCIDAEAVKASLGRIKDTDCGWVVPSHGRPVPREEADEHIAYHLGELEKIQHVILEGLVVERTTEQVIALVSAERGLSENPAAYWLAVTTVKAFLGGLLDAGRIEFFVRDHAGWWRVVN